MTDRDQSTAWPVGCRKPGNCEYNMRCSYIPCRYDCTDITADVEAALRERAAARNEATPMPDETPRLCLWCRVEWTIANVCCKCLRMARGNSDVE